MKKTKRSLLYVLLTAVLLLALNVFPQTQGCTSQACNDNQDLTKYLEDAGISSSKAKSYAAIFLQNHIDLTILPTMKATEFQALGISAYADCLDIVQYFKADTDDCAGVKNPCKHGGICKDGFKCLSCHCEPGYFGKTCEKSCPCRNNGRCRETDAGIECNCPLGFAGSLCEKQWLTEQTLAALRNQVTALTTKLSTAETNLDQSKKEIAEQKKLVQQLSAEYSRNRWTFIRVNKDLNQLGKLQLHGATPTYIQTMPIAFPRNTKAILISVFLNFWNGRSSHAYLNFITYQDGNEKLGKVSVTNTHFDIYANTLYYELMLPWDTKLPDQIIFKVTGSYNTGGPLNWYRVSLVGYITA